jgi:hypothetical protein
VSVRSGLNWDMSGRSLVRQGIIGPGHPAFLDIYLSPPFVAYPYARLARVRYPAAADSKLGAEISYGEAGQARNRSRFFSKADVTPFVFLVAAGPAAAG